MAETITANVQLGLTVTQTLDASACPDASAANRTLTHDQWNVDEDMSSSTTPAVTKTASFAKALVAGAATIDLTALVGANGAAVDGTGLKVTGFLFAAPAANSGAITIVKGATNGYGLLGAGTSIALAPGDPIAGKPTAAPTIAAGAKTLDLSGTGTDVLNVVLILG